MVLPLFNLKIILKIQIYKTFLPKDLKIYKFLSMMERCLVNLLDLTRNSINVE